MKLTVSLPTTNAQVFAGVRLKLAKGLTLAMAAAANGFKAEIRGEVRQNFKRTPPFARSRGLDFEKSFQAPVFPDPTRHKYSYDPAAFFVAKANAAEAFEEGTEIQGRRYLAIPLPAARKLGYDYSDVQRGTGRTFAKRTAVDRIIQKVKPIRVIKAAGGNIILAADAKQAAKAGLRPKGKRDFVPLVLLVKAVRVAKKLNFKVAAKRWADRLTGFAEEQLRDG